MDAQTPLWQPKHPQTTQLWQFMQALGQQQAMSFSNYQALYEFSIQNPQAFWPAVLDFFHIPLTSPHDRSKSLYRYARCAVVSRRDAELCRNLITTPR